MIVWLITLLLTTSDSEQAELVHKVVFWAVLAHRAFWGFQLLRRSVGYTSSWSLRSRSRHYSRSRLVFYRKGCTLRSTRVSVAPPQHTDRVTWISKDLPAEVFIVSRS